MIWNKAIVKLLKVQAERGALHLRDEVKLETDFDNLLV